jgi:DNA polymerase III epsilon subunit-like protein
MNTEIHFDLETGSLREDAAIYSIGAVAVRNGEIVDEFHIRINPNCYDNRHRKVDNTEWWLDNNPTEFDQIQMTERPLSDALYAFTEWLDQYADPSPRFWQKRMLDHLWLESAYHTCSIENPIRYSQVFELCTWFESKRYSPLGSKHNAHNALADARAQAEDWIRSNE